MDPFGNYLFQKLIEKAPAEQRVTMLKQVQGSIVHAALNLHGTRSVQKFIQVSAGEPELVVILASILAPSVRRARCRT